MENNSKIDHRCIFCDSQYPRPLGINPDFTSSGIFFCKNCKSIYTYPVPTTADLSRLYEKQYRQIRKEEPDHKYLSTMDERATAQFEVIQPFVKERRRYLEIGCGAGSLVKMFEDSFSLLEAYEPDSIMFEVASKRTKDNVKVFNCVCDVDSLTDNCYDLVTLSHVFEHLPDPVLFLKKLVDKLSIDGVIFIEVPNENLSTVSEIIATKRIGLMHLNFFNRHSFLNVFGKVGEVIQIQEYGLSNRLMRITPPNPNHLYRYIYWRIFRLSPPLFRRIGMIDIKSHTEMLAHFSKKNNNGVHLRIIIKNKNERTKHH